MDRKTAERIYKVLSSEYPGATTALRHKNALQLLVATILSAQCTDERVNKVTKELFRKYRKAKDFAGAKRSVLETEIRSTGFYKNKAKNIISAAGMIDGKFGGKVPDTMDDLLTLPGVARKTANIVLFHAYGKNEGVAVDTHVRRLSGRLAFTRNTDPVKIEQDLIALFERNKWGVLSNLLIEHGRKICDARRPLCPECPLRKLCPSVKEFYPSLGE
ncbi:MAG: endonuclease III [Candidatus Makaraimicrobium thalassicum]|nr:MAG: endonuclease III [Candidatus Omnitrophota bacterium]